MYPPECNESCEERRNRLYICYGVLLFTLIVLAGTHFIVFFVSRRRSKREARDYMARKQEFVYLSLSDLQLEKEARNSAAKEGNDDLKAYLNGDMRFDDNDTAKDVMNTDHEDTSNARETTSPSSIIKTRRMGIEGLLPGLQRIEEGSMADLSRCSTSSTVSRGRSSIRDAMHDPVIVTVATVSAIFEEESMRGDSGGSGREWEKRGRKNSTVDISDIIDSPRRHFPQPLNHREDRKSSDNTLSAHFSKRGSNHTLLKMDNHPDIRRHETISEVND